MKVLVSTASKYGGTSEIAQAIADVLAGKGLEVDFSQAGKGKPDRSSLPSRARR